MKRTTVVVDHELVERVKRLYGLATMRSAIDLALRSVLPTSDRRAIMELEGVGWDGEVSDLRGWSKN